MCIAHLKRLLGGVHGDRVRARVERRRAHVERDAVHVKVELTRERHETRQIGERHAELGVVVPDGARRRQLNSHQHSKAVQ